MAKFGPENALVNARILYWGAQNSGKSENLRTIYRRLRPDHRGSLQAVPTRIDPSVEYELLPIELGDVAGFRTTIEIIAVPGASDQFPTRKQLLDEVDGIVLVVDSQATRISENEASLQELRDALADYGRRLEDIPLVIQYNKRDLSDPYTLDELHRRLNVGGAAVFEAVATEATGVLKTLSTLSKRVVRTLRDRKFDGAGRSGRIDAGPASANDDGPVSDPPAEVTSRMEEAILAEDSHPESDAISNLTARAESLLDEPSELITADSEPDEAPIELPALDVLDPIEPFGSESRQAPLLDAELSISSVGQATRCGERSVRVPLVVADKRGRSTTLILTISLDALSPGSPHPPHDTVPEETAD